MEKGTSALADADVVDVDSSVPCDTVGDLMRCHELEIVVATQFILSNQILTNYGRA
ncbi:hypothetical protein C5167_016471 [Papaver somniferum]|nr:hypothetical protein C5167_016471 [Papaver somniferum]